MAATKHTFDSIKEDIQNRVFSPIYLFMGEEAYFIDQLTDMLSNSVLTEDEKDFNYLVFYGVDSDVRTIISSARRFPMMSEYQLIIIKEAQQLDDFDLLEVYAQNPVKSTILVINYKHKNVDGRKLVYKTIQKNGVIFESKKIYDYQVPAFIKNHFKNRKINIDEKPAQMLSDFVGNDLNKLMQELQKLEISLPANSRNITSELIEKNVGISKDYNNFELQRAIINKNILTANRIVDYFGKNPKENPIMVTVSVLFNYFSNLLECFWLQNQDEKSIENALGLRFGGRDYVTGMRNYNAKKVMEIISILRTYDAKSKGIENISASQHELMKEMVYKIMH